MKTCRIIISLVLIFALCALLPVLGTAECEHINCYTGCYWSEASTESHVYVDERTCRYIVTHVDIRVRCNDCGEFIETVAEDTDYTEDQAHEWLTDVCALCGAANPCAHENTYEDYEWTEGSSESFEYVDESVCRHAVSHVNTVIRCSNCNAVIQHTGTDTTWTENWTHDWQDGVCAQCGEKISCEHLNVFRGYSSTEATTSSYVYVDERTCRHTVSHVALGDWCDDCGLFLGTVAEDTSYTEDLEHIWENGICVNCGGVNSCAHENTFESYETTEESSEYFVFVDKSVCQRVVSHVNTMICCCDCGVILQRTGTDINWTENGGHDWQNNVCTQCGGVNTCAHENTYDSYEWTEETADYFVYVNEFVCQHVTSHVNTMVCCSDCGVILQRTGTDTNWTENCEHDWQNNVCTQCGGVNTCAHENTFESYSWTEESSDYFVYVDERSCQYTVSHVNIFKICYDCGQIVETLAEDAVYSEIWEHVWENNKCVNCGEENHCSHEETYESIEWTEESESLFVNVDLLTCRHVMNHVNIVRRCCECEMIVQVIAEDTTYTEENSHAWLDGVCDFCGAVNTCTHPNEKTWTWWDDDAATYTYVDNANCHVTVSGAVKYKYCDDCGLRTDLEHDIDLDRNIKHSFPDGICGECDYCHHMIEHTPEIVPGTPATCTENGISDGSVCAVCGVVLEKQVEIPARGHDDVTDEGRPATCTERGLTEGYHCRNCGAILIARKSFPALGHTEVAVAGYPATCTETGLTDGTRCEVCGETVKTQEEIPALGHTEVAVAGYPATCTETGLTDGTRCEVCGETIKAQEEIPALGHTETAVAGYPATCTEAGLTDGTRCEVCGETVMAQEEIPALGHVFGDPVITPAACEENGLRVDTCTVCGEAFETVLPAIGHSYEDVFVSLNNGTHGNPCEHEGCDKYFTLPCTLEEKTVGNLLIATCPVCGYSVTTVLETAEPEQPEDAVALALQNAIDSVKTTEAEPEIVIVTEKVTETVVTVQPVKTESTEETAAPAAQTATLVVYEQKVAASEQGEAVSAHVYTVALVTGGREVEAQGVLTVSLPCAEGEIEQIKVMTLVVVLPDGTMKEIPFEIVNGQIVFETDVVGTFAFIDPAQTEKE